MEVLLKVGNRTHPTVNQVSQKKNVAFQKGSWGVEIYEGLEPDVVGNGDVVVSKHVSPNPNTSTLNGNIKQLIWKHVVVLKFFPKHRPPIPAWSTWDQEPRLCRFDCEYLLGEYGEICLWAVSYYHSIDLCQVIYTKLLFFWTLCWSIWLCSGYNITMLKDATAGWTIEATTAATDLIWPLFANRVLTVDGWIETLSQA